MRFRLQPTPAQEVALLEHCRHARYVWNLACEQYQHWRPGRASAPGYGQQSHQLTEARREFGWLAAGSQTVQQQALRDFAQAMANFFAGTHRHPTWRKAGAHEGFRIVGQRGRHWDVRRLSRKVGEVRIPKVGWVRFRWSREIPGEGAKSFRVRRDRAGRWHVAFALIPSPIDGPGTGEVVGVDRGVMVSAALSTGEHMVRSARGTAQTPGKNVRAKAGLNRSIHAAGWGYLVTRLEQKAPGRVEKINPAYTSQICHACGHCAAENRESQAVFRCRACGHTDHADVNAARNIAVGRTVTGRGALQPLGGAVNREPQPVLSSA